MCFSSWALVLAVASPVLARVLLSNFVLKVWAQIAIVWALYCRVLRTALGSERCEKLLSARCQRARKNQADLVHIRQESTKSTSRTLPFFMVLMFAYLATHVTELKQDLWWGCATTLYHILIQLKLQRKELSPLVCWRVLWTLAVEPVHADGHDCEVHAVCAVCLDSLCTDVQAAADVSSSVRSRRMMLSACRLRSVGCAPGLAGARAWGLGLYKTSFTGLARKIARLPCGHEFHLGCIEDVVHSTWKRFGKLTCPTCRAAVGDTWKALSAEENSAITSGWVAVALCWTLLWVKETQ